MGLWYSISNIIEIDRGKHMRLDGFGLFVNDMAISHHI